MKNTVIFFSMIFVLIMSSCLKMNDNIKDYMDRGVVNYIGKVDSAVALSGKERIVFKWKMNSDPRIERCVIYWNNYRDSASYPVNASDMDENGYLSAELPIAEGTYIFNMHHAGSGGHRSVREEVTGRSYGALYEQTLMNRLFKSAKYDDFDIAVSWSMALEGELGVLLEYTDIYGKKQTEVVPETATATTLPDMDIDKPLFFKTMYKPDATAIDIFYAQMGEVMIPLAPYVGIDQKVRLINGLVGLWEFSVAADLEKASVGNNLVAYKMTANNSIGNPSKDGIRSIAGFNKRDYAVEIDQGSLFLCNHGIPATTSNGLVGEWTILWDVKRPAISDNKFCSLLETRVSNSTDLDCTIRPTGQLGVGGSGISANSISNDTWYRIVVVMKDPEYYRIYVNGVKWLEGLGTFVSNERSKLETAGLLLMADDNGEDNLLHVSTVAIWNRAISETEITSLGNCN